MKFSIITPSYNAKSYIAETIESVISQQGNFDIEYFIMDGGSTDGTPEIIKKYEQLIQTGKWVMSCNSISLKYYSGKDSGMYDAINKGFSQATGDIYAYINADDTYKHGAFQAIVTVLEKFPEIDWIKGITSNIEFNGTIIRKGCVRIYEQALLARGVYGRQAYFVEQDSVFWRANLWKKIGAIPSQYRLAGDYWLWVQFAQYAPLWSLNVPISCFRKSIGQLSQQVSAYKKEQYAIVLKTGYEFSSVRMFFTAQSRLAPRLEEFFRTLYPILFMRSKKNYFIDIKNNEATKTMATSYLIC